MGEVRGRSDRLVALRDRDWAHGGQGNDRGRDSGVVVELWGCFEQVNLCNFQ